MTLDWIVFLFEVGDTLFDNDRDEHWRREKNDDHSHRAFDRDAAGTARRPLCHGDFRRFGGPHEAKADPGAL
jgi:hypothetical protein